MKKYLSIIVSLMLIVSPVYALDSEGVIYDNSTSGSSATNVESALNDLYSKLNEKQTEINNIKNIGNATSDKILSGYTAYVKGNTITGSIPSKGAATYTPGTVNQTIASGQYLSGAQTIKGDANLVAANMAKGKSIFGISGTYTSDANAVAGNILSGKTAYINGNKITGTISSKGAATYTPGRSNQTIASGQYLSGTQTIKGDSNLVASNIAKGKTIFGVTGTYAGGSGIKGPFLLVISWGSSGNNFASVKSNGDFGQSKFLTNGDTAVNIADLFGMGLLKVTKAKGATTQTVITALKDLRYYKIAKDASSYENSGTLLSAGQTLSIKSGYCFWRFIDASL